MPTLRTCPGRRSTLARSGALALVLGLALGSAAWAEGETASTVRALIGADGAVQSVQRVGAGGTPSKDELPVAITIRSREAAGVTTTAYRVENRTAKAEPLTYSAASGKTVTEDHTIALPLVGQLRVSLPSSYKDIKAEGAQVVTNEDGSHELLWSMVLFAPIGSTVADAVFSARGGDGDATARLDVAPVVPDDSRQLSGARSAAVATVDGNVSLSVLTLGANQGLGALSDGVAKLIDGLVQLEEGAQQLSSGLGAGADGANQLAAGLRTAKGGSGALSSGLQQLSDGTGKLSAGAEKASAGSEKLVDGSQALATGAGLTADGAAKLSAGLSKISAGLAQLNGAAGLPAALAGAQKLRAGVDQLLAGLGSATEPKSVLGGLAALGGAAATGGGIDTLRSLVGAGATRSGCAVTGVPVAAPVSNCDFLNTAVFGLSHPARTLSASDPGGLKEQLAFGVGALTVGVGQVKGGLKSGDVTKPGIAEGLDGLIAGLTTAVGGIGQLATGATDASTGSVALAAGTKQVADGAGKLSEQGAVPLSAGLGELSAGAKQLAAGASKAATGSTSLDVGIGKISAGQDLVAAGLPKAVDGAGRIAEGLTTVVAGQQKVATGLSDLKSKATSVVADQLAAESDSAKRQIASLDATATRLSKTEGAATTTYVYAQDGAVLGLVKSSSESDSNAARNVGIGVGGVLLLVAGLAGGYLSGRRRTV